MLLTQDSRIEMNPSETLERVRRLGLDQQHPEGIRSTLVTFLGHKKMDRIEPGFVTLLLSA